MTNMKVFEPMKINGLELKTGWSYQHGDQLLYTGRKGNRKFIAYHEHKAKGGWQIESQSEADRTTFTPQAEKSQLRFIMPEERQAVP